MSVIAKKIVLGRLIKKRKRDLLPENATSSELKVRKMDEKFLNEIDLTNEQIEEKIEIETMRLLLKKNKKNTTSFSSKIIVGKNFKNKRKIKIYQKIKKF